MTTDRIPRDYGTEDIVLDHITLAVDHPLRDRLAGAAYAGCSGIGLFVSECLRMRADGFDAERLGALLDEFELGLAELEFVHLWPTTELGVAALEAAQDISWELADRFGCRSLQVTGPTSGGSIEEIAAPFGALCDAAADHGLLVGLEYLPFTDVASAADAWRIVETADRPNGGLCVDVWHQRRGPSSVAMLDEVPPEHIVIVQVNDGPLAPEVDDYVEDCLRNRRPPGDGEMGVTGLVARLLARGVRTPWSLEVCNEAAWGRPATPHVRACVDGMRATLAAARADSGP